MFFLYLLRWTSSLLVLFGITPIKMRFTMLVSLQQDDKGTILASNPIFFDEGTKANSEIWLQTNNCFNREELSLYIVLNNVWITKAAFVACLQCLAGIYKEHQYGTRLASKTSYYLPKARTNYNKFNISFQWCSETLEWYYLKTF